MDTKIIYIAVTSIALLAYYIRLWIKSLGAPGNKFPLVNLFNNGIPGAGELVAFIFVHIIYTISWITWYMVYT